VAVGDSKTRQSQFPVRNLVDLAQILDSYQQGFADIELANSLALGSTDMECEGTRHARLDRGRGETGDDDRSLFEALRTSTGGAVARIAIVGRDR